MLVCRALYLLRFCLTTDLMVDDANLCLALLQLLMIGACTRVFKTVSSDHSKMHRDIEKGISEIE